MSNDATTSVRIEPSRGIGLASLRELWTFRELLYFLVWRDQKVRYRQAVFGVLWALIQPLLLMSLFTVIFSVIIDMPSEGTPYAAFVLAGLVPWTFFAQALSASSESLVANKNVVSKIYFPRVAVPIAAAASYLIDLAIASLLLVLSLPLFDQSLSWRLLVIPLLMFAVLMTVLAFGVGLSALNVRYRDVRYAVPFAVQVWFFATPITYPSELVPESWQGFLALNPMLSIVDGFRWAALGADGPDGMSIVISAAMVIALGLVGLSYFRSVDRTLADVI